MSTLALRSLIPAFALAAAACSSPPAQSSAPSQPAPAQTAAAEPASGAADEQPLPPAASPYDALPPESRALLEEPFTGDLDEMVKRRLIRAGVVYNRTHYFIDDGVQRGASYEAIRLFEDELNKRLQTGLLKVNVAIVPLARDQLLAALQAGTVDFVTASLTITPERLKVVDFTKPTYSNVAEVPVIAPGVAPLSSPDDLSGREVFIRRSSSYYESVQRLNESLKGRGRAPVVVKEAPESLEDDDLLEMVNAGLVDITIADDFTVKFWQQVFADLRPQPDAAVRTGGEIAAAVRKGNPKMQRALNVWIDEYGPRRAFTNMMLKRYLQSTRYVKNAAAESERRKLRQLVKLFQTYGDRYRVDYLLMAAQGYQESQLDQSVRSPVGAIGVMQVMPATGKDMGVGDITRLEPNIHAGVKYFRFMVDQFYRDEPMDPLNKALMTLASYNAGPGRIRQLRRETARRGLNPNVWFGNVERVVSERIGRETVTYVSNIFKYYVAYRLVMERELSRAQAKGAIKGAP